jgi:hypothetical protein
MEGEGRRAATHGGGRYRGAPPWEGNDLAARVVPELPAHAFYRKCGFVQVGIAPYLFGNTMEQDVAMARPTAP